LRGVATQAEMQVEMEVEEADVSRVAHRASKSGSDGHARLRGERFSWATAAAS
jgi:hypothetical protein